MKPKSNNEQKEGRLKVGKKSRAKEKSSAKPLTSEDRRVSMDKRDKRILGELQRAINTPSFGVPPAPPVKNIWLTSKLVQDDQKNQQKKVVSIKKVIRPSFSREFRDNESAIFVD